MNRQKLKLFLPSLTSKILFSILIFVLLIWPVGGVTAQLELRSITGSGEVRVALGQ